MIDIERKTLKNTNLRWDQEVGDTGYIPPIVQANVTTKARTPHRLLLTMFPGEERHDLLPSKLTNFRRKCIYGRVLPAPKPGAPDRV